MQQKEQQQVPRDLEVTTSAPAYSPGDPLFRGTVTPTAQMVLHHLPDANTLQALGLVALRHGQLEYALRMVIKSLTGQEVLPALESTFRKSVWQLRKTIVETAEKELGPGAHLEKLGELIDRAEVASDKRNKYLHSLYAEELDGDPMLLGDNHKWEPVPTPEQLTELAGEIISIANELHEARIHGFLKEAIAAAKSARR